jgi:riboflavin biosynthesis pyrimidine reductase
VQVLLVAVQTLDGCITYHDEPGTGAFASREDAEHFARTMGTCDCSVFGSATFEADRVPITSNLANQRLRVVLTRRPGDYAADAVPGALEFSDAAPAAVLADLEARGFERCALLGGSIVNGLFLEADLVDELVLTLEPRILGTGTRLASGRMDRVFELVEDVPLNASTRLLRYRRPARD